MERRRGCASRCAAASMVDSGRVAPVISTHFEAATCCTAAVHAAALRKAAAASDGSQLRKRGRKAAGASTHRPLRSMSRRASDVRVMRPPQRRRRRRRELKSPFFFTELRFLTELQTGNRPEPCPTVKFDSLICCNQCITVVHQMWACSGLIPATLEDEGWLCPVCQISSDS